MKNDTADIELQIRTFLVDSFLFGRGEDLHNDDLLIGKVIDSNGVLELLSFLQDHFSIQIPDEDVVPENLGSVKNLTSYVARKLQSNA
jgi:acyl carrier protein